MERDVIAGALFEHCWNRNRTAEALGIDRSTLWRKMRMLGISGHL
jgi:transcriptional regulator of acetoin/glycerol metabolism